MLHRLVSQYSQCMHLKHLQFRYRHLLSLCMSVYTNHYPLVSLQVSDGGDSLTVGQNYTLTCHVSGAGSIQSLINYKWMKSSNSSTVAKSCILSNSSKLSFSPLKLSNAGNYSCQINVSEVSGLASINVKPSSKLTE